MNCVSELKCLIKEGPYFICVICHRCLYKRSVIRFDFSNYSSVVNQLVQLVGSYDHGVYLCKTCHSKVKKNKVPCLAVSNKLSVEWLPREFRNLRRLETVVVARRILF